MKQLESTKLVHVKSVLRMLNQYATHWNSNKPISYRAAQLRQLVTAFDTDDSRQRDNKTTGFTKRKNEAFKVIRTATFQLAMKLKDWVA